MKNNSGNRIIYRLDQKPEIAAIIELYKQAALTRPVEDPSRIQKMYDASNLILTAWEGDRLVGILRGWIDGAFDGYICDLAIHPDHQKKGIGEEILKRIVSANPQVQFVLRASGIAQDYYQHLDWQKIENGWFWPRKR